ncbi:MAG: sulfatase [Gemmataceae bacterium]
MTRRLLLPLLAATCLPAPLFAQDKRPNILFIMADDHTQQALGAYKSWLGKYAKTPNLDRLAKRGMLFKNALVTNSICTPSRAAILTGLYSHKNGVYTLADPIDPMRRHLAHLFHDAGYLTALFGKWHLHTDPAGFDHWIIFPGQGRYYDPILYTKDDKKGKGKMRGQIHKGYSTDVVTDFCLDWLKTRDKTKPFLAFCHFKAPHRPWDPAPRFKDLFKDEKIPEPDNLLDDYKDRAKVIAECRARVGQDFNKNDVGGIAIPKDLSTEDLRRWAYQVYMKRYLACVAAVDENVGRLLDFLEREGLLDNTIIIYTSDQGFFLGEHGWFDKRLIYEECLTTPLIVAAPGKTRPGSVCEDMVLNIDHAPTLLDLAGIKTKEAFDGKSYASILEGKTPPDWRKSMYYRYWMNLDGDHNIPAHYGVRTDRYTLVYYYVKALGMKGAREKDVTPEWELFDRKKDPKMMRNVYAEAEYQPVVRELKAELERLRRELKDESAGWTK